MTRPINQLFHNKLKVINLGLSAFKQALDDRGVPAVQVDWKPPIEIESKLVKQVRDHRTMIEQANAKAVKAILSGMPQLVGLD